MKKLLYALVVLALCSSVAMASVPDPSNCSVTPDLNNGVLMVPDQSATAGPYSGSILTVTVRNSANNPIEGALVEVELHSSAALCTTFEPTAVTDAAGVAQITLAAAGCVHNLPNAVVIRANGIPIRAFNNAKSPANGNASGNLPLDAVGLAALSLFQDAYNGVGAGVCTDITNNGETALGDVVIVQDTYQAAYFCDLE